MHRSESESYLRAPFPYFGGKGRVAPHVWAALGDVKHYLEPFFGSGAVLLARPDYDPTRHIETVCDKDGFVCLAPETRVLTDRLEWKPIGDCKVGDKLLAFDEFNTGPRFKKAAPAGYRHWRIATVTAAARVRKPCYRLTFSDGTVITCSEDHQWLGGRNRGLRWLTTKHWNTTVNRENQKAWVLKIVPVVEREESYEAGWLGGFAKLGKERQYVSVVQMEFVGDQEVVALETDTHTYIAEGLASHNCNVWRALQHDPDAVARLCDWPVNHADLDARRLRLIANEQRLLEHLGQDDEWYDARLAGYWIWAASCWIGSGLTCVGARPDLGSGAGVHGIGARPHLSDGGMGVHQQSLTSPADSDDVRAPFNQTIYRWFRILAERLRYVRVVCGDWSRVCGGTWQDWLGTCGIFFDPPYGVEDRDPNIYHHDDQTVAREVAEWACARGDRPSYRIVLAGYYEEHEWLLEHGWTVMRWTGHGGYARISADGPGKKNRFREALFFSPHCRRDREVRQLSLL